MHPDWKRSSAGCRGISSLPAITVGESQENSFLARCSAAAAFAALSSFRSFYSSFFLRYPTFWHLRICAKEKLFHLLAQQFACIGISHIQSIVINDECALRGPHIVGLFRDILIDALTQLTRKWRFIQSWKFSS